MNPAGRIEARILCAFIGTSAEIRPDFADPEAGSVGMEIAL